MTAAAVGVEYDEHENLDNGSKIRLASPLPCE